MTVYRGTSFSNDNGCYFTESKAIAATYAGWRYGSDAEAVVACEITPVRVFDANSKDVLGSVREVCQLNGWDADDAEYFANHYDNKPKSFFVGLIMACWRTYRFAGNEITNEEAENKVKDALRGMGFDAVKQMEKGGARYPDGTMQMPDKKAIAWILL